MASSLTRFECYIPVANSGTSQDTAIQNFFTNMQALAPCVADTCYVSNAYNYRFYGFLTNAQASTALGYLNTLNTALGSNVLCTSSAVTSQP